MAGERIINNSDGMSVSKEILRIILCISTCSYCYNEKRESSIGKEKGMLQKSIIISVMSVFYLVLIAMLWRKENM